MKLTDKVDSQTQRVLVYGGPKAGKTKLFAELAEFYNLLYFDLENGYITFRQIPREWQERVDIISIPDTKVYPIAIQTMLYAIRGEPGTICHLHGNWNCGICKKSSAGVDNVHLNSISNNTIVGVDGLLQLSTSAINHITKMETDDYKFTWDDYRKQGTLMNKFLSQVQQAKYNIVCITHEIEAELEDGRKKLVPIAGTTNFSRNTAKYFDTVVYCELQNKAHKFGSSTIYSTLALTGSRTNIELEKMGKPSLLPIFQSSTGKRVSSNGIVIPEIGSPAAIQTETNTVSAAGEKSPGQIAVENLRIAKTQLEAKQS